MAGLAAGSEVAGCRIEAVAGEGGMGVVYRATQLRLNRRVALKVIAPDLASQANFRERFERESLLAASIEHPNVIPVYEAGEERGLLYLVMRYVEGTDLRALIDREGVLSPPRAATLMAQVAAALAAAHRQELVHRDVKPANVLVVSDPRDGHEHSYLTDFGIAREARGTGGITRTGAVVGTTDYLAPERFEKGNRGDARSDIYAYGCMFYETLVGQVPYPRESEVATMFAHANSPVPLVAQARPGVPPAMAALVERCMAKEPADRYGDARELARATAAAGKVTPAPGTPPAGSETVVGQPDPAPTRLTGGHGPGPTPRPGATPRPVGPTPRPAAQPQPPAQPQPVARARPGTPVAPPPSRPPPPDPRDAPTNALPPEVTEGKKKLPVGALVALFVAVAAAAALILTQAGGGGGEAEQAGSGSGSGGENRVRVAGGPDGLTVVGGKVWVASAGAGTLTPIDGGRAGRAVRVGSDPDSVTSAGGSVWVTNSGDGTVTRVDDASGRPQGGPIEVGDQPEGIAAGEGAIFVANSGDGTLSSVDASSGRRRGTVNVGGAPTGVAVGAGTVWVTDTEAGAVKALSPRSGAPKGGPIEVGAEPRGVAVSGGDVWVANGGDGTVSRIDARTGQVNGEPIRVGGGPREVAAAGEDGVWVTLNQAGEAIRIDPEGQVAERKKVGAQPVGIAVDEDRVWVASSGDDSVTQIPR